MPFFQGSQRLSHNLRALVIFLKGSDFLSQQPEACSQELRGSELEWVLGWLCPACLRLQGGN